MRLTDEEVTKIGRCALPGAYHIAMLAVYFQVILERDVTVAEATDAVDRWNARCRAEENRT